ncbi:peptide chain release factor 1-like, mitochondrial [Liolophura sinensis]|uniref:peptide chain release factor 1-like, mitochondrial n=1 Tax=Liolophura sinensis TaxID=3198878 RepID=UPI0031590D27
MAAEMRVVLSLMRQVAPHRKYICRCVQSPVSPFLYVGAFYRHFHQQMSLLRRMFQVSSCANFHSLSSAVCTRPSYQAYVIISKSASNQSHRDKFSLENETFRKYLDHLLSEYESMNEGADEKTGKERRIYLTALARKIHELHGKCAEVTETQNLLDGLPPDEDEMRRLALEEMASCQEKIKHIEHEVVDLLTPDRSADHNDVILEVSAGVGGQEAMLFTAEVFQMYQNFATYKGWSFQIMSYEESEIGGLRRASASISGSFVYRLFKFEGGVHRVQRVPKTEKSGRVHTSTMTVAVLPQPTEIDITLNTKDLQIETCRASGKGGQHVNTTDSAVRIVHLPSGVVAECQEERSQIRNKEIAMKVLKSRIYQKMLYEQMSQQQQARKFQVGSAGRSEKIRTYNFSQDRITDHRLGMNMFSIERFMTGREQLENLLSELLQESRLEILEETLSNFVKEYKQ